MGGQYGSYILHKNGRADSMVPIYSTRTDHDVQTAWFLYTPQERTGGQFGSYILHKNSVRGIIIQDKDVIVLKLHLLKFSYITCRPRTMYYESGWGRINTLTITSTDTTHTGKINYRKVLVQ